jgi:RHS repeat-associated protein
LYDPQTKLVRFGARDYDPTLGRWRAKDPVVFADVKMCGAGNLYQYACSEPLAHDDPSGRFTIDFRLCEKELPLVRSGVQEACRAVRSERCAAMLQKFGVKECMAEGCQEGNKGGCKFNIWCANTSHEHGCGVSYQPTERDRRCGIALDNSRSGATQTCPQNQGRGYGPVIFHEFLHQCWPGSAEHPGAFCLIETVCMGVPSGGCAGPGF